ncbi:sigma-70 family RNA polymerase sigma factor [Novosphingobium sp.]|uniref:sigma-70 family RNA polymerase sigma factor n=1 Tax=Novosphingobium sp. TaxID=1874826 RepID=UPI002735A662|nr:sigma-70 family RNA polymerase sigma factor [Novosphingobium sp.]
MSAAAGPPRPTEDVAPPPVTPATAAADRLFRDQLVALLPSLRSFARGLCGWRDIADDMVQDAMLRGWAARASFTPGTNFRAWMFMILRNQFYSTIRRDKRMTSWDPEVAERVLVESPSQQDAIHLADVSRALQQLPPEQREVLLLIGANGATYEEAAEIIGCAVGTIKSRLARGRKALALLIDGPPDDSWLDRVA